MKKLMMFFATTLVVLAAKAQTNWTFDPAHTTVKFAVTHMVITEIDGRFSKFNGSVVSKNDDFTDANINFSIDVNSISTDNEARDKHLKGDDFFNAEKYPNITFKSTSFRKTTGNNYVLEGDLTIRDVTKRVKLDVVYNGTVKDMRGGSTAGFKVTGTIDRFDYNLKWNKAVEAGPVVSKDVNLTVNLELKKQ